jgi:tetratricopeptide (TPR) repeat protein
MLRANIKPVMLDKPVEWLKYEFIEHKEKHAVVAMQWEKLSVPFKIEVDVENIVFERMREQVGSQRGFNPFNMQAAANYFLNKNIHLDEALTWSQRAAQTKTFSTLNTLGNAYTRLNRIREADSVMLEALKFANVNQYMGYGRSLITAKRTDKAMEIFSAAEKTFGDVYAVNAGYMSGYSAKGNYTKALEHAQKALAQAPNENAKKTIDGFIVKLKEGKDINQ